MSTRLDEVLRAYVRAGCTITRKGVVIDHDDNIIAVLPEGTIIDRSMYENQEAARQKQDVEDQKEVDRKKAAAGDEEN